MIDLQQKFLEHLRLIPDFPKPSIQFRDLTPVLQNHKLSNHILDWMEKIARPYQPQTVAAIESRGFLFGFALALRLGVPFVPIRKSGKLPADTYKANYNLEYGTGVLEIHKDAIPANHKVLIHDDLLATGGTINAAQELISQCKATPVLVVVLTQLKIFNPSMIKNKLDIISLVEI